MTTYSLGQVETAVAKAHGIREDSMPTFRARLRHLRNLNVPMIPNVGSGSRVEYTIDHVRQMFLAIELQQFGMAPKLVTSLIHEIWEGPFLRDVKDILDVAENSVTDPWYLLFHPFWIGEAFGKQKDEMILVYGSPFVVQKNELIDKLRNKAEPEPSEEALRNRLRARLGIPDGEQLNNPRRILIVDLTQGLSLLKRELALTQPSKRG